ncbi:hypothetical protein JXQ31_07245 [candidate division KSB1 bacterium]|nr:hypothetical protein [candidate division KSB1 bacterium]
MYTDKPEPSGFYISFCLIFILLLVVFPVFATVTFEGTITLTLLFLLPFLVPLLIFIAMIHAAYNTTYVLNKNILKIKCGFIMKGKIETDKIIDIKNSRFNTKTLGSGFREKGYCNRFTNGLILKTNEGKIYISPSDNERFKYELDLKRTNR